MTALNPKPKLLIVDDNIDLLSSWQRALRRDFDILTATSAEEALQQFRVNPGIALLDIRLDEEDPQNQEGIDLLKQFLTARPDMPVVMITAYGDVTQAVECMKLGAADFVEKKASLPEIRQRLSHALQHSQISRKAKHLEEYLAQKEPLEIIGESLAIQEVKRLIQMVAKDGHITVLIRGETGTGKELVAKAIHRWGWRANGPFVAAPLVSIPETLIESELFGHEPGTFTDAKKRKIGWIEKAHGGVLFLDEIGDLPMEVQIKLLRFLEERQFTRLGSTSPIHVDVQVVSATHQNLEQAVKEGRFREDLYYRLKGMQIDLPPLRERPEDIPLLAQHFLHKLHREGRTRIQTINKEVFKCLEQYPWPGNIRELNRVIEAAILLAQEHGHTRIEIDDLPSEILQTSPMNLPFPQPQLSENFDLSQNLARVELSYIEQALHLTRGRKTEAWKILGLNDRFALRRRVKIIFDKYPELKKKNLQKSLQYFKFNLHFSQKFSKSKII